MHSHICATCTLRPIESSSLKWFQNSDSGGNCQFKAGAYHANILGKNLLFVAMEPPISVILLIKHA